MNDPEMMSAAPAAEGMLDAPVEIDRADDADDLALQSRLGALLGHDVERAQIDLVLDVLKDVFAAPASSQAAAPRRVLEAAIAEVDARIGAWTDAVMHTEAFRSLESAWRGVERLVSHTEFGKGIQIELVHASKEDLAADFANSRGALQDSWLYHQVHEMHVDRLGGRPVGAIVSDVDLGPGEADVELMRNVACVAEIAHTPFIAAASPELYGLKSWSDIGTRDLSTLKRYHDNHAARFAAWNSFRNDEPGSRFVVLTCPRFLARRPHELHGRGKDPFVHREDAGPDGRHLLYASSAFLLAERLHASFAKNRWHGAVAGVAGGGEVTGLVTCTVESAGRSRAVPPLEADFRSLERGNLVNKAGLSPIEWRENASSAVFFDPRGVYTDPDYGDTPEGNAKSAVERQLNRLPFLMLVSRLGHQVKLWAVEHTGMVVASAESLKAMLAEELKAYVNANQDLTQAELERKPFRRIDVFVEPAPNDPSLFLIRCRVRMHDRLLAAEVDLECVAKDHHGRQAS